jgi:xanthine/CO dehydrogenase XdhC/CoxF family maturation factor
MTSPEDRFAWITDPQVRATVSDWDNSLRRLAIMRGLHDYNDFLEIAEKIVNREARKIILGRAELLWGLDFNGASERFYDLLRAHSPGLIAAAESGIDVGTLGRVLQRTDYDKVLTRAASIKDRSIRFAILNWSGTASVFEDKIISERVDALIQARDPGFIKAAQNHLDVNVLVAILRRDEDYKNILASAAKVPGSKAYGQVLEWLGSDMARADQKVSERIVAQLKAPTSGIMQAANKAGNLENIAGVLRRDDYEAVLTAISPVRKTRAYQQLLDWAGSEELIGDQNKRARRFNALLKSRNHALITAADSGIDSAVLAEILRRDDYEAVLTSAARIDNSRIRTRVLMWGISNPAVGRLLGLNHPEVTRMIVDSLWTQRPYPWKRPDIGRQIEEWVRTRPNDASGRDIYRYRLLPPAALRD